MRLAEKEPVLAIPRDKCEYTSERFPGDADVGKAAPGRSFSKMVSGNQAKYPFYSREMAEQACVDYGCDGLAAKEDIQYYAPNPCYTAWTSDSRGWYSSITDSCANQGWNGWCVPCS